MVEQPKVALDLLNDEELLAVCDYQPDAPYEEALSDLLECNREGTLNETGRRKLDDLMQTYREGLVRKAQALNVAVSRDLRPRLS